jgi:hypothetical protein
MLVYVVMNVGIVASDHLHVVKFAWLLPQLVLRELATPTFLISLTELVIASNSYSIAICYASSAI